MAGAFTTETDLLAPVGDDEGGPGGPNVMAPPREDPVPDVRTMLCKRREVRKHLASDGFHHIEVLIRSMNAAERADWVASITTVVDDDGKVQNVHPLNRLIVSRCIHYVDGRKMFANEQDAGLDEVEGVAFDELVTLSQEVCGLATGAQQISTEEEITVKD